MKNETLTAILNEKDKLSAYMGVGVDYDKGETGKSGADEVYIGAEPPTDPEVKLWVDTEDQSYVPVEWKDVGNKPNFATVATSGSYNDLTDKPTIPEPYTLPTASTTTLGGVKVDGETITIADGVISSAGGGGSINAYKFSSNTVLTTEEQNQLIDCVKNREKIILIDGELVFSINTEYPRTNKEKINSIYFTTIANKDMVRSGADVIYGETNTYNCYTFSNFPGGWQIKKYTSFENNALLGVKHIRWPLNKQDIKNGKYNWMIDWAAGKEYLVWVNNYLVYATRKYHNCLSLYLMGNDYGDIFNVANINIYFTDTSFTELDSTKTYSSFAGNTLLTSTNWNNYISVSGGSDWQVTTSTSESNLYNAKEVVIFWQDSSYNRHQSYLNVGCDYYGNSGSSWGNSNWLNTQIRLDSVDFSNNGSSITYDGNNINTSDCTIEAICYKT